MSAGWVYVLDPGVTIDGREVVKVGFTTRSVEQRARELSTGSPTAFTIAYRLKVEDAKTVERLVHQRLKSYRVRLGGGREFFALEASEAIKLVESVAIQHSIEAVEQIRKNELEEFKKQIGASRAENIANLLGVFILTTWSIASIFLFVFIVEGPILLKIVGQLFLSVIVFGGGNRLLEKLIVERRFGAAIRKKTEELERKYPKADSDLLKAKQVQPT